jgi:hypothetical protein
MRIGRSDFKILEDISRGKISLGRTRRILEDDYECALYNYFNIYLNQNRYYWRTYENVT